MTKIKLNDRVRHVNGRIGTVVYDDGQEFRPMWVVWDHYRDDIKSSPYDRAPTEIAEVIGHRYFIDTPCTVELTEDQLERVKAMLESEE
jgi:hypothetical protein